MSNQKIHIGCSGFSNKDWKSFFYPENLSAKEYLPFYSTYFDTVEINSTFYKNPTSSTLQKWYLQTPEKFSFFIKIPKSITHISKLQNSKESIDEFCMHIHSNLKEKLSGFLFQLPPSFLFTDNNLEQVLNVVDRRYLNVFEFRHKSWWNKTVKDVLAENNIVFSGVNIPLDIPNEIVSSHSGTVYYRLHGNPLLYKSIYMEEELEHIAEEIKKINKQTYVFFNNTWGKGAIKNGLFLQSIL